MWSIWQTLRLCSDDRPALTNEQQVFVLGIEGDSEARLDVATTRDALILGFRSVAPKRIRFSRCVA